MFVRDVAFMSSRVSDAPMMHLNANMLERDGVVVVANKDDDIIFFILLLLLLQ
jgi:hypothetical protein